MKTIKYVAKGKSKVVVGGVEYTGKKVIPIGGKNGLSDDDVKRLLKDKFIERLELDEDDSSGDKGGNTGNKNGKPIEKMNKAELLEKAKELPGLEVNDGMTVLELRKKIGEALAAKA